MLCHLLSCWIKWFNFPNISLKMKSSNFIKLFHVSYTSDLPCGHTSSSCVRTEPHPIPAKQHGTVVPAAVPFDTRVNQQGHMSTLNVTFVLPFPHEISPVPNTEEKHGQLSRVSKLARLILIVHEYSFLSAFLND